jgi:DNA (cytosine-5)-methyltransferase 1
MRFASVFAGIGGFDLGFEQVGMTPTAQVEISDGRRDILAAHWPNVRRGSDVCSVSGTELGEPDLIVGGFPCQDTSIAAPHRAGLDGKRSGLFYEFVRLVDEVARLVDESKPRWVCIENPVGLLKSNGGRDMAAVVGNLADLGYGWAYRVVDSQHLGSAQRRQRVLVVGHRGGDARPAWSVLGDAGAGSETAASSGKRRGQAGPSLASSPHGPSGTLIWRKSARPRKSLADGGYETWVPDDRSNTLTGFDGGNAARQTHLIMQQGQLRTLTHVEWERLQGFPDEWTAGLGSKDRYSALGDAMNVPMAQWLGRRFSQVHADVPML